MDMSSDILIPIPRDCISKDGDALPPIDQIFYFNLGIFCAKISILMIHFCNVSLKRLAQEKKNYPWQRPKECPNCKERLWGHGYVLRYFNSFPEGVFLRRWQCSNPKCRCLLTCRPAIYWRRYRETITRIFDTLIYRVKHRSWPPWTTRQRGDHWLEKLIFHSRLYLLDKGQLLETILFYKTKNLVIF